ncbi:CBS domain-containing protein [Acidianus sulfidivorans JP7]|uniref:Histidine kinase n=1 Tax=Acidianus sulfidivorans JP7 TaxID=619593 RepID=A0A2U9IMW9_9CREN|nr:CBS domain-containing protein [Acidianus sulfidivorans]AWR97378.1 CBS domain-containing protein [Acidianus sulfidivorans JP7]
MLVKTLEITKPPIISKDDNLLSAFKKINERGIGRIIISNDKIEGILSTRDLLYVFLSFCPNGCSQGDLYKLGNSIASNYMTSNPVVVNEKYDTLEAITLMVTRNFGALPVVDDTGKPTGIVTEREMLLQFQDLDPLFPVSMFMSKRVTTITSDILLDQATRQMLHRGFRRLPVIDDEGKVIGIITAADSIKYAAKCVEKMDPDYFFTKKVKDIMKTSVMTIEEDRSINEAAAIMIDKNIGSLLILDDIGRPKAIITERDLLIALHYQLHLPYVYGSKS